MRPEACGRPVSGCSVTLGRVQGPLKGRQEHATHPALERPGDPGENWRERLGRKLREHVIVLIGWDDPPRGVGPFRPGAGRPLDERARPGGVLLGCVGPPRAAALAGAADVELAVAAAEAVGSPAPEP